MINIPAIDLLNQKCVRLQKGDFEKVTSSFDDPVAIADKYQKLGVKNLHIVDLNSVQGECSPNIGIIKQIRGSFKGEIQLGGGIRTKTDCQKLLEIGVNRLVVGSMAVQAPELLKSLIKVYGKEKFILALDVIEERGEFWVATNGWKENSKLTLNSVLNLYPRGTFAKVMCTDISRDGMMNGPNFDLYQGLRNEFPEIKWIASGGVAEIEDIEKCQRIGLFGVIIGKALLDKRFSWGELVKC